MVADPGADAHRPAAAGRAGEELMPRRHALLVHRQRVADFAGVRTVGRQAVDLQTVDEEDERLALRRIEVVDTQRDRLADAHFRLRHAPDVRRARGQQQQCERGEHFARVCTP